MRLQGVRKKTLYGVENRIKILKKMYTFLQDFCKTNSKLYLCQQIPTRYRLPLYKFLPDTPFNKVTVLQDFCEAVCVVTNDRFFGQFQDWKSGLSPGLQSKVRGPIFWT